MKDSLFNVGGKLSKPANTLIEKVSGAVGMLYEPTHIRRIAKAEADAALIAANPGVGTSSLRRRAFRRWIAQEERQQTNMESVLEKTIPKLATGAAPDAVEDDWIVAFFEKARMVPDEQIQELWSRILAGQANAPGSFSRQTVNILADLDRRSAFLFRQLCRFCVRIHADIVPFVHLGPHSDVYLPHGIDDRSLRTLASLNLVHFASDVIGLNAHFEPRTRVIYHDEYFILESATRLSIGSVLLSRTGEELYPVSRPIPIPGFLRFVQRCVTEKR